MSLKVGPSPFFISAISSSSEFLGVPVGETSGLGTHGHHVKVEKELEDIGLIIAASSYLLYSTG
jgi:hypothetical protein